jgi:hypothetical protein
MGSMLMGVADLPSETLKALKIHPKSSKQRRASQKSSQGNHLPHRKSSGGADDASTITDDNASSIMSGNAAEQGAGQLSITSSNVSKSSLGSDLSTAGINEPTTSSTPQAEALRGNSTSSLGSPVRSPVLTPRDAFVAQALEHTFGTARQRSPSSSRSSSVHHRSRSRHENDNGAKVHFETALGTGKGLSRFVGAGLKSPMDFSMALARGFHNAPKLYGDQVRKTDKITDLQSGLKVAGKVRYMSIVTHVGVANIM